MSILPMRGVRCAALLALLIGPVSAGVAASLVFEKTGYVDCGDLFNAAAGTIEFRCKPKSSNNNEWILAKSKDDANGMLVGFGPGIFMFLVKRAGEGRYAFVPTSTLALDQWQHVAITFEKDSVSLFVNGTRQHTGFSDPGGNYGLDHLAGGRLWIGRGEAAEELYHGALADIRLSNGVRYAEDFDPARVTMDADGRTVALWRGDGEGATLADASGNQHAGRIVGAVRRVAEAPATTAPVPPPPAPPRVPAPRAAARTTAATHRPFTLQDGAPLRTAIRADGTLLINDRPVFPIGMRTEQVEALRPVAEGGFNLVLGSGEWEAGHYRAALESRLLVLGGFYEWATFATFRHPNSIDLRPSEEAGLRTVVRDARDQGRRTIRDALAAFGASPHLIGWNTNEEPEAKLTEAVEYGYEIFKSQNPARLVVSLSCDPRWFHLWKNTADVLLVDNYPFRGSAQNKASLLETYEWVRSACRAMDGKAVWLMPQLIPPSFWSRKPDEDLSLNDMRLQNYVGLIGGAKGILMYEWRSLSEAFGPQGKIQVAPEVLDRRWGNVSAVAEELAQLGPMICDGRPTQELAITWLEPGAQGPGPQLVRELDYYGVKYLLAANLLDAPVTAKVNGINGGNPLAYDAKVFLGGGQLAVSSAKPGEPRLTIGPRGAGVFVLERRPVSLEP